MVLTTTTMAGHQQMTAREKDIYDTYSEDLEGLTFNSKPIINSMTELANEYSSDFAHVIVRCIEDKIKMVQSSQKLPLLYLLDSVLKNHTRPYHDLFQQNIVSIFAHVFHNVPREHAEKVRTALYKLRTTWTDTYFSLTKLNQLDRKIQTLDPQWPIIPSKKAIPVEKNYKPPSQSIHINPAVFGRQQSLTPENDLDAQMKQKELELMELKMKREELALENMRQQLAAGREAKITDDRQQPAVIHQSQSTSLQDRAKSPLQDSTGISTSVIGKANSNRIIIDEKKLKDPRMRNKILEAINKAEGNTNSGINKNVLSSRRNSSKSVTPERNNRITERSNRSKSKSPSSQRSYLGQATSTTGTSNVNTNKDDKTSRTPSPIRARQSPTSTSSPRYADTSNSTNQKKGTTPPPPPRISDVIKGSKIEDRKSARDKSSQSSISSSKAKKRKNEDNAHEKGDKREIGSKSTKILTNIRGKKDGVSDKSRKSHEDKDDSSSSPSPPPDKEKKLRSLSSDKDSASSGINFRVKGRQKVKEKYPFRIPKKEKSDTGKQDDRTPSPQSFTSEGPLVEFNEGRSPLKERKRHGSKSGNSSQSRLKKSKLSNELFGDGKSIGKKVNSADGWALVKKEKPDVFRTQVIDSRVPHEVPWRGGFRNNKNQIQNSKSYPGLFQGNVGGSNQQGETESLIENISKDLKNYEPEYVLEHVIPDIVSELQNKMKNKEISVEQFSAMMKEISLLVWRLKEQVMMKNAERRHNNQQIINPWQDGAVPGENLSLKQQQFDSSAVRLNPVASNINMSIENIDNPQPFPSGNSNPSQSTALFGEDERISDTTIIGSSSVGMANRDLPMANDTDLAIALADPVKRIEIDEYPRDIRFYNETALIIMGPEAKDMRELRFKNEFGSSSHRRIIIDQKYIIPVEIASPGYKEFKLDDGITHTIKIGAPTRELWIDGQWHELYFNKSGNIKIGSSVHDVFLEGPSPNVDIGSVPRNDLCVGTVQLIIDGDINTIVTIYLDSKPQLVNIAGKQHILKFVQGLKMLLINDHPFRTEFGGMPMVVYVNQVKHYLRLTALPGGVKLNAIKLWNMEESHNIQQNPSLALMTDNKEVSPKNSSQVDSGSNIDSSLLTPSVNPPSPGLMNENSQEPFSVTAQNNAAFDRLINMIPTTPINLGGGLKMPNATSESTAEQGNIQNCSYTSTPVSDKVKPVWTNEMKEESKNKENEIQSKDQDKSVDVHNLWAQLLGAGLVSNPSTAKVTTIPGLDTPNTDSKGEKQGMLEEKENLDQVNNKSSKKKEKNENDSTKDLNNRKDSKSLSYKDIILKSHHTSIKTRQAAVINMVYDPSALQCKNCGLRFSTSHSDATAYSKHLDWHFRVKRREKDNAKKAESRRWYFEKVDWIISDEVEDEKEGNEDPKSRSGTPDEIPMVPAGSSPEDNTCPICHEEFDQFYKQDFADISSSEVVGARGRTYSEDDGGGRWHLKNAIRPEVTENDPNNSSTEKYAGRAFHPQCYQDRNNATLNDTSASLDQIKCEAVSTTDLCEDGSENDVVKSIVNPPTFLNDFPESSDNVKNEEQVINTDDSEKQVEEFGGSVEKIDRSMGNNNIENEAECNVTEESNEASNSQIKNELITTDSPCPVISDDNVKLETDLTNDMKIENAETEIKTETALKTEAPDQSEEIDESSSASVKDITDDKKDSLNLLNKSLDGNTLMARPIISGIGSSLSGGIKINIRPTDVSNPEPVKREISRSVSESDDGESEKGVEFDPDAIIQAAKPEHADMKPKLSGRKLVEMPMQRKGGELSSLCSIM